jgi:hypothetical protein
MELLVFGELNKNISGYELIQGPATISVASFSLILYEQNAGLSLQACSFASAAASYLPIAA